MLKSLRWQSRQAACEIVHDNLMYFKGAKRERGGRSVKTWRNIKKKVRKPHDAVFTLKLQNILFTK